LTGSDRLTRSFARPVLFIPFALLLAFGVVWLYWYPLQVVQAITGFNWAEGAFVGSSGQSQIFSFSIAGGALSLLLMTYWIYRQEGSRRASIPVALAVGYICTIAVTMWYEQVYANLWDLANGTAYWFNFYANPPKLLTVVVDMGLLFVAYPWMRRANLKLVTIFTLLTLAFFGLWYVTGYGFPTSSASAYLFNGGSRIFSGLAIATSVIPAGGLRKR